MEIEFINDIEVLTNREEKQLQINDLNEENLNGIWPQLLEQFSGFNAMFCYHNTRAPINALEERGISLLDNSREMRLTPGELTNTVKDDVTIIPKKDDVSFDIHLVNAEKFDNFAKFHDLTNPDMYWNSARVKETIDTWRIHTYSVQEKIVGYIMIMNDFEVICAYSKNTLHTKRLMAVAAADAFLRGSNQLLFMLNSDEQINNDSAVGVGFVDCGFYHGFRGVVSEFGEN